MKKGYIVLIIIVIVIAGVAIWYFTSGKKETAKTETKTTKESTSGLSSLLSNLNLSGFSLIG